jgi:hypothetical protein
MLLRIIPKKFLGCTLNALLFHLDNLAACNHIIHSGLQNRCRSCECQDTIGQHQTKQQYVILSVLLGLLYLHVHILEPLVCSRIVLIQLCRILNWHNWLEILLVSLEIKFLDSIVVTKNLSHFSLQLHIFH